MPLLPPLENGGAGDPTQTTLLRYILDALIGGGSGGAGYNMNTYNKPKGTVKNDPLDIHTITAGTAHTVIIVAAGREALYNFGTSVNLVAPVGVPIYLTASTCFSGVINVICGSGGEVYITEIQPQ